MDVCTVGIYKSTSDKYMVLYSCHVKKKKKLMFARSLTTSAGCR